MHSVSVIPHVTQPLRDPFWTHGEELSCNQHLPEHLACVSVLPVQVLNQSSVPQLTKAETITDQDGLGSGQL